MTPASPPPAALELRAVRGDITRIPADAIVNAARSSLLGGGGVDGAIHRAGGPAILAECRELRASRLPDGLPTGEAVATTAGDLPARWVIHTVGPVFGRGSRGTRTTDPERLADCYRSCLAVADEVGAGSVTFPLIAAGSYGWPHEEAVRTAISTLRGTSTSVRTATLVLFDDALLDLAEQYL